jgi:hypothetical protein
VGLALFAPVLEWVQQLGVHSSQAGQVLGIHLVGLAPVGVDEPQFAGVGHKDLVATLLQEPANPGRVGSGLDGDAQRGLGSEASPQSFWGGSHPTLLDHLAAVGVQKTEIAVFVAEIEPGCHLRLFAATIHGGPILLPGR